MVVALESYAFQCLVNNDTYLFRDEYDDDDDDGFNLTTVPASVKVAMQSI